MTDRQMKAAGTLALAIGVVAVGKMLADGQGAAFGLSAVQTTALVGIGATAVVTVLAARSA